MHQDIITLIRDIYKTEDFIPLHEPRFRGNEKKYINECIDSTFVSSVGKFVDQFEASVAKFTGAKYAVAMVNGTAALHIGLLLADVTSNDEVITQPLTFVATANAISYCSAHSVFVDVDRDTMGLSPEKLKYFLEKNTSIIDGKCINNSTKRIIKAVVPMHTFGLPTRIDAIVEICNKHHINVVEDAAESLGSYYKNKHTGTFGLVGTLSFNGNKTITTGGGGMIITDNKTLAEKAKYITTTAKVPHPWEYHHDVTAYNYRLPNLNAALGCAQMESLPSFLESKQKLSKTYSSYFKDNDAINFIEPISEGLSNFWLNAIELKGLEARNEFLKTTNEAGVMTRPIWKLMNSLPMYNSAQCGNLDNSEYLENRIVNLPSSVI
ncbi:LegC family aminotransferase [Winogradskyella sp. UBA3174]|uniref:LegC family aminotransferase n=1 Tax=Winogradskyella sp. UBA3174 TaxID=1947785 RepID=UPI0025F45934|nr:LegC family aminotransferase [Winogradskyella sp. UBA3174]|tara:strand:+ start:25145 stop:26284 length:1140 start_codon:yes stop_codon:yes gene_type:complete